LSENVGFRFPRTARSLCRRKLREVVAEVEELLGRQISPDEWNDL
jgi:hypothetical protein